MRVAVVNVDDADEFAGIHQRNGKKGLVGIFLQGTEALEARVLRGVLAERDHGVVYGDPTRDAFAHLQSDLADFRVVRKLRGAQNDLVGARGRSDKPDTRRNASHSSRG